MVTPFKDDYSLDEDGIRRLVDYFIEEEKVDGLTPCGTTGESPALTPEEHKKVIEIVVKHTNGRVPVMAGTGFNNTYKTIEMTKFAEDVGADGVLLVSPYYNKPTKGGMTAHFEAVAKSTNLPIFLYNVPSRTGKNLDADIVVELSKIDNIIGIKDASGNINETNAILLGTRKNNEKFYVLSGEDAVTFPILALGGHGTICAVGNVIGREYTEMCRLAREGRWDEAREIHFRMLPVVKALFIETNPIPVKEAMNMMGLPAGKLRLPLVPMSEKNREYLRRCLKEIGRL